MALLELFQTKPASPDPTTDNQSVADKFNERKKNYQTLGFREAGKSQGYSTALESHLKAIDGKIKQELADDHDLQETERNKISIEITELTAQKENAESKKNQAESNLSYEEKKIEDAKKQIAEIHNHPDKIQQNPATRASFIIGLLILIPLTLYLFIYYSSASYSAIFKEFTTDTETITQNVLDPNAIGHALQAGWGAFAFVLLIPFVFLGLGYLIHKFGENNGWSKYFKIFAIITVTFIFDALIAYKIEEASYNFTKLISFTPMPDYNFNMAFSNADFWLIIFMGFIVYIMWGFVFDFVMDSYEKLDRVHTAIKELEKNIKHYKEQCKEYKKQIQDYTTEIQSINHKIDAKNIGLQKVIYPRNILKDCLNSYLSGWLQYLAAANSSISIQNDTKAIGDSIINELVS